jgi:hypothetical protein
VASCSCGPSLRPCCAPPMRIILRRKKLAVIVAGPDKRSRRL